MLGLRELNTDKLKHVSTKYERPEKNCCLCVVWRTVDMDYKQRPLPFTFMYTRCSHLYNNMANHLIDMNRYSKDSTDVSGTRINVYCPDFVKGMVSCTLSCLFYEILTVRTLYKFDII